MKTILLSCVDVLTQQPFELAIYLGEKRSVGESAAGKAVKARNQKYITKILNKSTQNKSPLFQRAYKGENEKILLFNAIIPPNILLVNNKFITKVLNLDLFYLPPEFQALPFTSL